MIGDTDIRASRIGLGTWAIGGWMWGGTDEAESIRTIHAAADRGITLIDTAPIYGHGRAEEIVGKAVSELGRERFVIATKAGLAWDDQGRVWRDSSPKRLHQEIDDSLRRLGIDHVDLLQIHWPDANVPFDRTARTMEDLRTEGKVRAIGVSNFSPEQMDRFGQGASLQSCQPPYNLFERQIEQDVLPYCRDRGISAITYGALCRGLLSGKVDEDRTFPKGDLRRNADPKFQQPRLGQYLSAVRALDDLARERYGKRVLHLALRWLLEQPGVSIALWGARRPDQLAPLDEVWTFSLGDEVREEMARIVEEHVTDPVGPEFMGPE